NAGPYSGLGTYAAYLSPRYRGNAKDFLATLKMLRDIPVPDLVLPGHPGADWQPQSPRLTQEQWQAFLSDGIRDLDTLLSRYAKDGANFLDGVPKQLLPGLHYFGNYAGSALYALVTPARQFFLFDAPGGPGLPTFLNMKFREAGLSGLKLTAVLLTSTSSEATGWLRGLIEETGCSVVAPQAGLGVVKECCPIGTKIRSAETIDRAGWFQGEAIALEGRGHAAAYNLRWAKKSVVISGQMPIKPSPQA